MSSILTWKKEFLEYIRIPRMRTTHDLICTLEFIDNLGRRSNHFRGYPRPALIEYDESGNIIIEDYWLYGYFVFRRQFYFFPPPTHTPSSTQGKKG